MVSLVLFVLNDFLARLPFAAVDNKSGVTKGNKDKSKVAAEDNSKTVVANASDLSVGKDLKSVNVINMEDLSKSNSLPPEESDESNSIQEVSMVEDEQNSEVETSCNVSQESGNTTPSAKLSTPRQSEREKARLERLKAKEVFIIQNNIN